MNKAKWLRLKQEGSQYYKGLTEPVDLYAAGGLFRDFALANIIKYAYRNRKGAGRPVNIDDLKKIIHYTRLLEALSEPDDPGITKGSCQDSHGKDMAAAGMIQKEGGKICGTTDAMMRAEGYVPAADLGCDTDPVLTKALEELDAAIDRATDRAFQREVAAGRWPKFLI